MALRNMVRQAQGDSRTFSPNKKCLKSHQSIGEIKNKKSVKSNNKIGEIKII